MNGPVHVNRFRQLLLAIMLDVGIRGIQKFGVRHCRSSTLDMDRSIFLYLKETNLPIPLYIETTVMASGDGNGGSDRVWEWLSKLYLSRQSFVVVEGERRT